VHKYQLISLCLHLFSLIGQEKHRKVEEEVGQGEEERQEEEEDGSSKYELENLQRIQDNRRLMMDAGILPATTAIRSAGQTRNREDEKKRRSEKKIQKDPDQMNKLRMRVPNDVKTDVQKAARAEKVCVCVCLYPCTLYLLTCTRAHTRTNTYTQTMQVFTGSLNTNASMYIIGEGQDRD